jgi:hypothetical protein
VPGWSAYYLDYKFLKKIISSLTAHRPASEAAALALGLRPADILDSSSPSASSVLRVQPSSVLDEPVLPPLFSGSVQDERGPDFRAHKAAFFFKLERELEKVCSLVHFRPLFIFAHPPDQRILLTKGSGTQTASRNSALEAESRCDERVP